MEQAVLFPGYVLQYFSQFKNGNALRLTPNASSLLVIQSNFG